MQDFPDDTGGLDAVTTSLTLTRDREGTLLLGTRIKEALDEIGAGGRARYRAELVAEEILTNLVKYGGPGDGPVELRLCQEPTELRLEILDQTPPYSPESSMPTPLGANPSRDGGLGLELVRRSCDALFYDADEDGRNRLIAVFNRDSGEDERDRARLEGSDDDQP